jgi:hypothetical protein
MEGDEQQGGEQYEQQGAEQMDMDDDDEHEINIVETTDRHQTSDSTASGSRHKARWKSHAVMPPLVPDSEDENILIKPTGDM